MANKKIKHNETILPIRDLLFHCFSKWYWFVISLAVSMGVAVLYILSTPPVYVRSAEIRIKNNGDSRGNDAFKITSNSADANTEVKAFRSPGIMKEVIERLDLDIEYSTEGKFFNIVFYKGRPFHTATLDLRKSDAAKFTANIKGDSIIELNSFTLNGKELGGAVTAKVGDTVQTPAGRILLTPTKDFAHYSSGKIFIEKKPMNVVINEFCSKLSSGFTNENTSIIRLTMKDVSTIRATDILNTIIDVYNEQWLARNNSNTVKIGEFIQQRVDSLNIELNALDLEIARFESENRIVSKNIKDLSVSAEKEKINERLIELNNQLEVARAFHKMLTGNSGHKEILPTTLGIEVASLQAEISKYNEEVLKRNRLLANSSEKHPAVQECNLRLNDLYLSLNSTTSNHLAFLEREIKQASKKAETSKVSFEKSTTQVKDIQGLLRNRKIKSELYRFLLQKLEEAELSKAFETENNTVLVKPSGSNTPVAPMQRQAISLALAIGLLLPLIIIFVREITNQKVRGRKDLEGVRVPFLGEIPFYEPNRKRLKRKESTKEIIVKEGSRNIINEAFRVLRTNLEFMNDKENNSHVIIFTSFNPGSGKTFLTMNIAASLALKGSKVLVIDGDMRHGSTSGYVSSPETGLCDYLSGGVANISEIIVDVAECPNLKVIPIGSTPPNPTELLHGKRFSELLAALRKEYDYVLIDCPPIDIVADTQIIEEHADRSIFVVRANLLNREMLDELEDIYDNKRLKNLSMILNGTYSGGTGYRYKYGYSYSYGYGYGYGYHYHQKK